jgi:hypothetical protein
VYAIFQCINMLLASHEDVNFEDIYRKCPVMALSNYAPHMRNPHIPALNFNYATNAHITARLHLLSKRNCMHPRPHECIICVCVCVCVCLYVLVNILYVRLLCGCIGVSDCVRVFYCVRVSVCVKRIKWRTFQR